MKSVALILVALPLLFQLLEVSGLTEYDLNHECLRSCEWPSKPKTCVYNFTVDWFYSMSIACNDCPINKAHCHNKYCIPLNGVARPIAVVNEQFPGPSIQVCEDDNIVVHVSNEMSNNEGITLHWHGMYQRDTPYMDGVPMVTQCPIHRHNTFTYNFKASPYGTTWWHAHSGTLRADGVFGALVVRQASQKDINAANYDYDLPEHVIAVNDWFDESPFSSFFQPVVFGNPERYASAQSLLINGKGKRKGFNNPSNETVYTEREIFTLEVGKRYRFRMYSSVSSHCPLKISVDSHKLTIIASDGAPVQPYETDAFVLQGGERYDFVIETNQEVGNYWMRVQGDIVCETAADELALIRYQGAQEDYPAEEYPEEYSNYTVLNTVLRFWQTGTALPLTQLESAENDDETTEKTPDVVYYVALDLNRVNKYFDDYNQTIEGLQAEEYYYLYSYQMNHLSFKSNSRPPLTQFKEIPEEEFCVQNPVSFQPTKCEKEYCECAHTINVDLGQVVEIVMVNEGNQRLTHPIHLHGQHFRVVAEGHVGEVGEPTTIAEFLRLEQAGNITRKLQSAIKKDTVIVHVGAYTVIRFVADNPGWWLFHCHLEFHQKLGMSLMIHVGSDKDLPPMPADFPRCGSWPSNVKNSKGAASSKFNFFQVAAMMATLLFVWKMVMFY